MNTVPACKNCRFWRRGTPPKADELREYCSFHTCNLSVGGHFVGDRVLGPENLTSPDGTCELFRERGDIQ